jgi:hypothetical protein
MSRSTCKILFQIFFNILKCIFGGRSIYPILDNDGERKLACCLFGKFFLTSNSSNATACIYMFSFLKVFFETEAKDLALSIN